MNKYEYINSEVMKTYYRSVVQKMASSNYKPDLVIGLLRGGAEMAVNFSHYFAVPCEIIKWQLRDGDGTDHEHLKEIIKNNRHANILIVDDLCDTGASFQEIDTVISSEEFLGDVVYAVCIENMDNDFSIDYSARQISRNVDEQWFVFPCESWWL